MCARREWSYRPGVHAEFCVPEWAAKACAGGRSSRTPDGPMIDHSMNDVFFFFSPVVSTSALSCLLFPFRAEEAAEVEGAALLEGAEEGSSTPAGFMNAVLVDFGADDVLFEDKERRSTPTLLLSYITRLAGSLSFFDGLASVLVELDIDLILIFLVSSG